MARKNTSVAPDIVEEIQANLVDGEAAQVITAEESVLWIVPREQSNLRYNANGFAISGAQDTGSSVGIEKDRGRSYNKKPSTSTYSRYQDRVSVLASYRKINPLFERLLFQVPKRLAVTPGKAVLKYPNSVTDDAEYDQIQDRVLHPFKWFNAHVNEHLVGKLGGTEELTGWLLDHLLEGGACGYQVAFSTVKINGVSWRVPKEVRTFSGRQMGVDETLSEFSDEAWYLKVGEPTMKWYSGMVKIAGYDQTDYSDASMWMPLTDRPDLGLYRGVVKLDHPSGSVEKYPTPPYFSLADALLGCEMLTRDDLSTLAYCQRVTTIWKFDVTLMREAMVPWKDTKDSGGNTVSGALSVFRAARENLLANQTGGPRDLMIPSYISHEEVQPGLALLQNDKKSRQFLRMIEAAAGIMFDENGLILKEEGQEQREIDFLFLRERIIERFFTKIYQMIIAENRQYFGQLNGVAGWDPFVLAIPSRRGRPAIPTSVDKAQRNRRKEIERMLDGEGEELRIIFQLVPSSARRNDRFTSIATATVRGLLPVESFQEAGGWDPDEERAKMERQQREDFVTWPADKVSLWTPTPTMTQTAITPAGTMKTVAHQQSPGRPVGTGADVFSPANIGAEAEESEEQDE